MSATLAAPVPSVARAPTDHAAAAAITARIERLPPSRPLWTLAALLAGAGFFEIYELAQTTYIPAGLIHDHIFRAGSAGFFGLNDQATFAAATFLGLFVGTIAFTRLADRFGRRGVFTWALLGYTAFALLEAAQSTPLGIDLCRFAAGIGIGVELVTGDAYLVELMPSAMRGRAFALFHVVSYIAFPVLAIAATWLLPAAPLGLAGWRWLLLAGGSAAIAIWVVRRRLPESPVWLAGRGRREEAERTIAAIERSVVAATGRPLADPVAVAAPPVDGPDGPRRSMWAAPYGGRLSMMLVFNFFQTIAFFGFGNWIPALLAAQGTGFVKSLSYSIVIAVAFPVTPLIWGLTVAERVERKFLIVGAALGIAVCGLLFARQTGAAGLMLFGVLITAFNTLLSLSYHPYQSEIFPTAIRARAVGFAYSFSRLSTVFTSFLIAFFLDRFGTVGVFAFISASMVIVIVAIGGFGPRTRGRSLEEIAP